MSSTTSPPPGGQLPLFPGITGPRPEEGPPADSSDATSEGSPALDIRQIELFADHVALARDLELAISGGRFEEAARIRLAIDETFGASPASPSLALLDRLASVQWEGPPGVPLAAWAELDPLLAGQPSLQDHVRTGAFTRLLQTRTSSELLAARPDSLPALVRVLALRPGRSPQEARLEARGLVRDSLLAGRMLDALDFRQDEAVADLLPEDMPPRWLASLGRLRRLWPAPPPAEAEWEVLREIARGDARSEDPALAFWHCMRIAESPDCPDGLRHQARRRMKQLHPDLHALFMRREPPR